MQISFDGIGLILGTLLSIPPAALLLAPRGRAAGHHREGAGSWVMAGFGLVLLLLAVLRCTAAGFLVATNVGQGSGSCFTF